MNRLLEWIKRVDKSPRTAPFFFAWSAHGVLDGDATALGVAAVVVWGLAWWFDARSRRWDWEWKGDHGVLSVKGPLTQQQADAMRAAWADLGRQAK